MHIEQKIIFFYRILVKKTKKFILNKTSKDLLVFLFFLFIATLFWMFITLNLYYETNISIPIKLVKIPHNVFITEDIPSYINVKVRDKGTVLLSYKFNKKYSPILIDFYNSKEKYVDIKTSFLEKYYINQFNSSTKILSLDPSSIKYVFSDEECKRVPICIKGEISPVSQYYIVDTIINPKYIVAYAPKEILNTIKDAYTLPLVLKNITNGYCLHVSLKEPKGVKFIPSSAKICFKTDIYSEEKFNVPIHGVNFPKGERLLTFPSKVVVSFQTGSTLFKQIRSSDFAIQIAYEEVIKCGKEKLPLRLTKIPYGVRNIKINPAQIDFLIEKKN